MEAAQRAAAEPDRQPGHGVIIWYGGILVIRGQLTLGELVAFTTYLGAARPTRCAAWA